MQESLLIELLTEELPPKSLLKLSQAFCRGICDGLKEHGFVADDADYSGVVTEFATPRRLGVLIKDVAGKQTERSVERKGPAVNAAFDKDGKQTPALSGFAKSCGVAIEKLEKQSGPKGEHFVFRAKQPGEPLEKHLSGIVASIIKKLPVAKLMRWGEGEVEFVRPAHGLMMVHGKKVVPGEVLSLHSSNKTMGQRFLSVGEIIIAKADDYERVLEAQGNVIASFDGRRTRIEEQLKIQAQALSARVNPAAGLLDEVTALVEWPVVYVGEFEAEYLAVPQECLILTMQQNQKYFPLLSTDGKLLNKFLIVSNMQVDDPGHIIGGNQRVVRPRLGDARFFYNQDRKQPLESRVAKLGNVVYHSKLGTQLQRVERMTALAGAIAHRINADKAQAQLAARLAKADLVTGMVGEFPELQGIMGRYYALHDGEEKEVADAIAAHYHPRFAGDTLPQGGVACAVALADKLDTLVGIYGIGLVPTGDKDPFGLRRHALGVLRILIETPLPLPLDSLLQLSRDNFSAGQLSGSVVVDVQGFMLERLRGYLRERDFAVDEIEAVVCLNPTRIDLVMPCLDAVRAFRKLPEAAALATANKRVLNILEKNIMRDAGAFSSNIEIDSSLLKEPAEVALHQVLLAVKPQADAAFECGDYTQSLKMLAALKEPVDAFFDGVMVNADDVDLRANRLGLLTILHNAMNRVGNLSKLAS